MEKRNQKSKSNKDEAGSSRGSSRKLSNDNKIHTVGKIKFNQSQILGEGCRETIVYRGEFDGRPVAVKRILPRNFKFGDREAKLLRISDGHPNVIRYYCTERDKFYHYVALDLCVATLGDWVEGKYTNEQIDGIQVLKQASKGLAHLHSLNIVHRDLKPGNILLQVMPGNEIKTVISDLGFSKQIENDNMQYVLSSGIPGTYGWIAPEVLKGVEVGLTIAVDIFSMGCVFYYVLTHVLLHQGHHPFGEPIHWQSNIVNNVQDLGKLTPNNYSDAVQLVRMMILEEPSMRPPIQALLSHPMFWHIDKILHFCTDISNRISKESGQGLKLLKSFEDGGTVVVGGNWTTQISPEVFNELNKPRAKVRPYNGDSVKDLLRALRNSLTHFHDMSKKFQTMLGGSPVQCVQYWMERFPLLLPHTWYSFEPLKVEQGFRKYYSRNYDFSAALDYMKSLSNTPVEEVKEESIDKMPKVIVDELVAKKEVTSTWKTAEVSKSPPSFKSVCTVRSKLIGTVTVQGVGPSEKEAEHNLALEILARILDKSPKVTLHEACAKRKVTPSYDNEQLMETPSIFRSICIVPNMTGMETSAEGDGQNKKEAEQKAALRVLPKSFTSDELLPFINLFMLD